MVLQYLEEGRRKMSKILLKINDVKELSYEADGYILGIDKYSFLFGKTFNIDEIKKIKDDLKGKEIFVSFNRVIFNSELEDYKKKLKKVDSLGIAGIIVGDIAALTYDIKTNVILDQMHLNNSFYAINHYYNNGVYGTVLTNDITLSEINDIKKNTKSVLFKQVFGYPHLSTSKRRLISNYKEYFNINDTSSIYEISEKNSNNIYYWQQFVAFFSLLLDNCIKKACRMPQPSNCQSASSRIFLTSSSVFVSLSLHIFISFCAFFSSGPSVSMSMSSFSRRSTISSICLIASSYFMFAMFCRFCFLC